MENLEISSNFWKDKKVFLTGHTGFKGTWLSIWLKTLGANVYGYALEAPTQPSLYELTQIKNHINSTIGNVQDYQSLKKALERSEAEIVIHMAAQPLVRLSYENPIETYATNVLGTVHLLEAIRYQKTVRSVVIVSSDKCYENKEWHWGYREDEPMGGYDPYSNSKGCTELVTSAFRSSYFHPQSFNQHKLALASARAGNVIGGGDWALDRLIPDLLKSFEKNQDIVIRNPRAIRPWQHVLEPLSGYLMLAEKLYNNGPQYAEGWNFGPFESDVKDVEWITKRMKELSGKSLNIKVESNSNQPHEAKYLKLDSSKARSLLKWRSRWTIEQTLESIMNWHNQYIKNDNLLEACKKQIEQYSRS